MEKLNSCFYSRQTLIKETKLSFFSPFLLRRFIFLDLTNFSVKNLRAQLAVGERDARVEGERRCSRVLNTYCIILIRK